MLKSDAIGYFGTQQKLAAAVQRSPSTISEWGEVVPLECAFIIERLTAKKVRIDPAMYPKLPPQARRGA